MFSKFRTRTVHIRQVSLFLTNSILLQTRPFLVTPNQLRTKIEVKNIDPKLELPTDPYILAEWVQNLGNANKLDDAISIVWHSKKEAQSEVVWNHLIVECVKKKEVKMGFRLFNEMKKHGFVPNDRTFTILLNGLADYLPYADNIAQARSLISKMNSSTKSRPVELNVYHVNCLLKLCSRLNNFDALQENFNEMINIGDWTPNQETFTIMLNACARQGEKGFLVAVQLWNHINSIIGDHRKSAKENNQPRESDGYGPELGITLEMDDELVRAMLLVCRKTENYDKGFEIIRNVYGLASSDEDLLHKAMAPSSISYRSIMNEKSVDIMLSLCIGARKFEKGIMLFDEALSQFPNLSLDIYNFNKLITCYNQVGKFTKSIDVYYPIKARGLEPTLETYDMLLTACRITEDWIAGKEFFKAIIATKRVDICLDSHLLNMILELSMLNRKPWNSPKDVRWVIEQIESFGPSNPNMIEKFSRISKKSVMKITSDEEKTLIHCSPVLVSSNYISMNMPVYNIKDLRFLKRIVWAYESALEEKFLKDLDENLILRWKENLDFYRTMLIKYDQLPPLRIKLPSKNPVMDKNQREDLSLKKKLQDENLRRKVMVVENKKGSKGTKREVILKDIKRESRDERSAWRYVGQYARRGVDRRMARVFEEEGE
ncbi:5402_t:CDS:2, partial [Acaulospora morrowiae]